jgi:hypothetical protein
MKCWPHIFGIILPAGYAHFQPRPISPEKTAAQLESRRLDDGGLKKFLEQNLGRKLENWPQTESIRVGHARLRFADLHADSLLPAGASA